MNELTATQIGIVQSGAWFSSLPELLQAGLIKGAHVVALSSGQRLFARDDPADGLYAVLSGGIRITAVAESGKEAILNIVEAPHWFGEIALFDGQNRTHDALAERETMLIHVPIWVLRDLLLADPRYWQDFGRLMTHKMRLLFMMLEDAALQPASARVAKRLLAMSAGYGEREEAEALEIRVQQEQLGMMLALTRQTVNQILRQFEDEGAIKLVRGGILIVDVEMLEQLAV